MKKFKHSYVFLLTAIGLGIIAGYSQWSIPLMVAEGITKLFMNLLQLIAGPMVFLALLSTLIGMQKGIHQLVRRLVGYTLLTTTLASLIALILFLTLDPVSSMQSLKVSENAVSSGSSYGQYLLEVVPSNFIQVFLEQKIISIAFLGVFFGIAAHFLPDEPRKTLHAGVHALFQLFLKAGQVIVHAMPVAIWAFTALMVQEIRSSETIGQGIATYLAVVLFANLIQGVIVIPILLKIKGLSPWEMAKRSLRPLSVAFFTKSSNATLPISMQTAERELKISPGIVRFSLPLCTVINMNGCAAFILSTVLFISGINGVVFSVWDLAFWVILSVLAAVGNAGVPMGCFFLSSALLLGMNVPIFAMGMILPFYAILDMVETALNVWSDLSVTAMLEKDDQKIFVRQKNLSQ